MGYSSDLTIAFEYEDKNDDIRKGWIEVEANSDEAAWELVEDMFGDALECDWVDCTDLGFDWVGSMLDVLKVTQQD